MGVDEWDGVDGAHHGELIQPKLVKNLLGGNDRKLLMALISLAKTKCETGT